MIYSSDAPPVRSLDVADTKTVNRRRYEESNCRLRLNLRGQPVAIRRVPSIGQPGSFLHSRFQVVKPDETAVFSHEALKKWDDLIAHPVN